MTAQSPNEARAELAAVLAEVADNASLSTGSTRPKHLSCNAEWIAAKRREMTIALKAAEAKGWRFTR